MRPGGFAGGAAAPSRSAVRRFGTALAVLCLAVSAAACTSTESAGGGDTTSLRVDVTNEPDTLDPMARNTPETQRVYRLTYSGLLSYKEDQTLVPDLAAAMPEVSADRLTYTIKLREGVTFHDGAPFTAKDVVFTYDVVREAKNASQWRSGLRLVDTVEAQGDYTVVIKLKSPYSYLDSRLAMIPILSSATPYVPNQTYTTKSNGTGPYKLKSFAKGENLVLEANDKYFGAKPSIKTVTLNLVPENASRIARLVNGQTDIVPELPASQMKLVSNGGQNAVAVTGNVSRLFLYPSLAANRPTANADFRLAVAWAIDRQQIVNQVYAGQGRPNSTYLTYGTPYHDEQLGLYFGSTANAEKAKSHLAAAGGAPSRPLEFIVTNVPELISAATIIQANLKAVGIEVRIEVAEVAAFYPRLVSGEYDFIMWRSPTATSSGFAPDYAYGGLYSNSANNLAKFSDPKMDQLLDAAISVPADQQAAAWKAVQEYDVQTQGNIQVVVSTYNEGYSKALTNYAPSKLLWLNTLAGASISR
ncbi:ABC transporter substrate-binding protein [Dactylosporangium sucinum]|nr:ABC transporter substrate-binding protein [Dactylosporangium sucinum]